MKTSPLGPQAFAVPCPECNRSVTIPAEFGARLTVDDNGGRLSLRMSTKSLEHDCADKKSETKPLFAVGGAGGDDEPDVDQ